MRKETQKVLILSLLGLVSVNLAAQQKAKKDTIKNIDEVVVTALGIKRQDKSLGYVAEKVNSGTFEETQNNNWAQSMEGKVAGLKVQTAGAGPLASSRITLRGEKSMVLDNNYALIVVDGIPLGNSTTGTGTPAYGAGSGGDVPIDLGNGLNSINPDDIESVTVLKGASAAALYGSRAANGALMITTKSGKSKNGKIQVTFNSYSSYDTVLKWPDWQYEYGQGTLAKNTAGQFYYSYGASADGVSTGGTSSAFGPKFAGQYYFQYDPAVGGQSKERQLWRAYEDNIKGFWRTGSTYSNSLSVESSNDKTNFRTSLTYLNNEWMMPNTGFDRLNFALSFAHQLTKKLKVSTKFTFNKTSSDNLPATGYNNQSISYFMIFQNPNVDLAWYQPIWKPGQVQIDQIHPFSTFIDNPYLIAYEMLNGVDKKTIFGNITADYQFNKNFSLMLRSGLEVLNEKRTTKRPWSSANYAKGFYREQYIKNHEYNNDILFSYKQNFNKFNISASAGGSIRYNQYVMNDYQANGLKIAGEYNLTNALGIDVKYPKPGDEQVNSVYGLVTLGYDNKFFVDITGRNDWSSTLPKSNRSFFYPSVSTSFILSEIFKLKSDRFNYWKLRASWAKVGIDGSPYQLDTYYDTSSITGSVVARNIFNNPNLKPEKNANVEAGMDFSVLKNRLNFNFTLYQNMSENQIIPVSLPYESGYSQRIINAGKIRNRGLELSLNTTPFKTKSFSWMIGANWSANENRVLTTSEGFDGIISTVGGVVFYKAVVGGSLGDMYGFKLVKNGQGQVVYDNAGLPLRPAEIEKVGNAFPKWRAGLQNDFKIKNFTVSFSFDGQYGGVAYSQSHHKMSEQGKLKSTLPGRDNPNGMIVGEGVVQNPDGSYSPNTKAVTVSAYYAEYYRRANVETNTFSTDFIKLRDARIAYSFPKETIKSLGLQDLTLAIFGKNLWMWTKFPLFDPEVATLDNATITPGVEMGQLPTARTVGFQLNLKF
ncbi:SusC/RagA family TonB-linked outer membrane protein [Chryseobacterium gambrini]|uniref:SusC/RagA family TonB-linked outer membrane protein n=1 Tax=Chryseobacterium gambrini TaxID=373672 RepID=A0AAJ1R2U3_9FLAO|nr:MULTISPECIES: SusC/RagA family TonB-linked outer membrane protein [Chryseobacterium]MDN4011307.1 SusC/RagA family TonB-linked outer membrane protein [Chryseobacterium gambrini]MDN4031078.1 SusC/RagA family TonB-linked outer membrane protein [Chryseobacterium gambrini]QWA38079.1 SusC/RagA family TonB-linked outer membrane protein [Chryseobacterium sp. ZHDP1]